MRSAVNSKANPGAVLNFSLTPEAADLGVDWVTNPTTNTIYVWYAKDGE